MNGRLYVAALLVLAAGSAGLLWLTGVPLGVPGEWTWSRIRYGEVSPADALVGALPAVVAAALYAAACWAVGRRMVRSGPVETGGWLAGLVLAGFALLFVVQSAPPAGHDLARLPLVIYDPGASGYFTIARYENDGEPIDVRAFLAGYEDRLRQGDVLHIGTHPPGLVLVHRGLIALCRSSPGVTRLVRGVTPRSAEETFGVLDRHVRRSPVLSEADRAALWLTVLVTQLVAAAAAVPLYLVLRRTWSQAESWRAACLWPLVPAVAVFLPKSDALYPFVGMLFLWLWLEACARGSILRAVLAGGVLWAGLCLSLALLPVAALGAFLALWEWRTARRDRLQAVARASGGQEGPRPPEGGHYERRLLRAVAAAAGAFAALTLAVWLVFDLNLVNAWLWNYRNHAAFYDHYPRTWWKWVLVNPAEFSLAAGVPLAVAAAVGVWRAVRAARAGAAGQDRTGGTPSSILHPPSSAAAPENRTARPASHLLPLAPAVGCLFVWGLVWLWGKNMGEAARLWLVFQPWLVWLAAGAFAETAGRSGSLSHNDGAGRPMSGETRWLWTLAVQAIICLATVLRVSGFHYLEELPGEVPVERDRPAVSAAGNDWRDHPALAVLAENGHDADGRFLSAR